MADDLASPEILALNARYGARGRIAFREGPGGFTVAVLACQRGSCEVCLHGGHVLSYRPIGHAPVLWLSAHSLYEPGKPIRGGIPVCWPWFGACPGRDDLPMHGFARLCEWSIVGTEYSNEKSDLRLVLRDTPETRAVWPHAFELELHVILGDTLTLRLTSRNTGGEPFTYTEALHGYYAVRQIADVCVMGLEGAEFSDRLSPDPAPLTEESPVVFRAETDRIYSDDGEVVVSDPGIGRDIVLTKSGSASTVVWNPWIAKSRRMADFGDDEYLRMLCVEQANVGDAAITLPPGKSHTLALTIRPDLKST